MEKKKKVREMAVDMFDTCQYDNLILQLALNIEGMQHDLTLVWIESVCGTRTVDVDDVALALTRTCSAMRAKRWT